MSLVTDVASALDVGEVSPLLLEDWQEGAQAAWLEETNARAMAVVCGYGDLALGVRVAVACEKPLVSSNMEKAALSQTEEWANGQLYSSQMRSYDRGYNLNIDRALSAAIWAASAAERKRADKVVKDVIWSIYNIGQAGIASIIRSEIKTPPPIRFCKECGRPATYLQQWLSDRVGHPDERTQVHWRLKKESACRPTRILAERVRAGLSPVSLVFEKRQIVAGESGLEALEEAASSSGRSKSVQKAKTAWAHSKRVLEGQPWNVKFLNW